ncbi:uncharacterized protein [Asterias amurensis]|uniref:uncharacterized protein isoform X1 n=1 Tax=Asterias amurensis TaxID=7602 RepID=UPI003AB3C46F
MASVVKEECVSMDSALKDNTVDDASFCTSPNDKSEDGLITPALSASRKMLCQVCGALSSGLHFGVFTCEGCKCFYRRSIKEGANYACAKDRNCDITMETRNSCRFCRFQKCLALGMSKEGIKLGRRPKVDSDVFQQGYYHPGDMEMLHSHGQQYSWPGAEHLGTHYPTVFKSEPTATDIESHGEQPIMNYSLKREAYTTCDQHNGLHYSHHAGYLMPSQQPDVSVGMPSPGQERYEQIYGTTMECVHPQQQVYLQPDSHPHHVPMSNPVPIMNPPAQTSMEHQDTSRSWTAELSPSSSISSASEDAWEAGSMFQSSLPSSVTLTLPEVHSGAVAAMAYANLYRGKNESPSSTSSSLSAAERLQEDDCSPSKKPTDMSFPIPNDLEKDSRSYTELVPRKNIEKSGSQTLSEQHEATVYANNLQAVHSALALSPKPASPACSNNNIGEAWVEHDMRQQNMRLDPAAILLDLAHPQGGLKMGQEGVSTGDVQGDESLLHDITAFFLELKMNILRQWKTHCSEVCSLSKDLDISWEDVGSFVNTDRTIADHVRCFVNKVLSLVQKRNISGVELMNWNSLSIVVKTCLLLDISMKGHLKVTGGHELPHLLTEEAACICILTLFSSAAAVTGKDSHIMDACQWICQAAQDYLREKCETEERFQEVIQLLQGESTLPLITSSA